MVTRLSAKEAEARVEQARAGSSDLPEGSASSVTTPTLPTCLDIAERLIEDAADRTARWSLGVHEEADGRPLLHLTHNTGFEALRANIYRNVLSLIIS